MFQPIKKESIAEQIARSITIDIIEMRLQPGEKLPPERELAIKFGTNRNTLREAMKMLSSLKLIRIKQGEGVTICDYKNEGNINLLPLYLQSELSFDEKHKALKDILNFRRILLVEAINVAASNANEGEINTLRIALSEIIHFLDQPSILIEKDMAFYQALISATGSLVFIWLFNTFSAVWNDSKDLIASLWVTPENYISTLEAIITALEQGEGKNAGSALKEMLKEGDLKVFSILKTFR